MSANAKKVVEIDAARDKIDGDELSPSLREHFEREYHEATMKVARLAKLLGYRQKRCKKCGHPV